MKAKCLCWMVLLMVSLMIMGSTETSAAEKVFKWKMQSFMPSGSTNYKYLQDFCEKVKKATNNRLIITLFPAGALFPDTEAFKNVSAGVAEIAYNYCLFYQGIVKEALTLYPPYGIQNWEDMYYLWYYGGWKEIMEPYYTKHNIHNTARIGLGAEPIWSKVPIRSMNDFKGLKMRMTGAAAVFFSKKLGASVSLLPGPEVYTALKLGTVDACEYSGGALDYDLGIHEVTKYMIMPYYVGQGMVEYLVNLKAYKSLPEDIRTIFDACCSWAELYVTFNIMRDNEIAKKKMIEKGMQVIWLPDQDVAKIRELAREFWDENLATISPDSKKLIELYKARARDLKIIK